TGQPRTQRQRVVQRIEVVLTDADQGAELLRDAATGPVDRGLGEVQADDTVVLGGEVLHVGTETAPYVDDVGAGLLLVHPTGEVRGMVPVRCPRPLVVQAPPVP